MISLAPGTKVFLACCPIDLRAGFNGLAAKVQQVIGQNPFICVGKDYVTGHTQTPAMRRQPRVCPTHDPLRIRAHLMDSATGVALVGRERHH